MKKLFLLLALGVMTTGAIAQKTTDKKVALPAANAGAVVAEDVLEGYVGTYELMPNFNLKFFVKGGKLISQATGQDEHQLLAMGDHVFKTTTFPATITFVETKDGTFKSLILSQGGQEITAPRIE